MSMFDHDSKMYRFPSFHETPSCDQAKTAQESLRAVLAKFPSNAAHTAATTCISPPPSSSSSASSTASSFSSHLPPSQSVAPLPSSTSASLKRPSNAGDYRWISTHPRDRSSGSSTSSKGSSNSSRNRKSSVTSNGSRKSSTSRVPGGSRV